MRLPFTLLTRLAPLAIVAGLLFQQASPALACGGLVSPNGAIRLARATTLVAWHDGIEHYMTSFTYAGDTAGLGWIVPLPAVPLKIEEGGAWTLQRLFRETHPIVFDSAAGVRAAPAAGAAEVLQQVQVEALDITVLRGSGQAVIDWCATNGFVLSNDTRAHLLIYAQGSPLFMAAKYDTSRAQARHQLQGDGSPVLITMRTAHPWVPLEVLALDGQQVDADLYMLTDQPLNTSNVRAVIGETAVGTDIPGAPGFRVAFQEQMTPALYHDLSTDRNMSWVRPDSWLTYLSLDAPDSKVTYDLGVTTLGVIRLAPFGTPPMAVGDDGSRGAAQPLPRLPLGTPETVLVVVLLLGMVSLVLVVIRAGARPKARA